MKTKKLLLSVFMLVFCLPAVQSANFYFVKPGASGSGVDWANAMDLVVALSTAQAGDDIFVAAGEYTTSGADFSTG